MRKRIIRAVTVGNIAIIALSVLIYALGMLQVMSSAVFDYSKQWSMLHQPHEDIIVVGIDDASIQEIGTFPFDRKVYVPFIRNAERLGAEVIAFDITFENESNPESDRAFAAELAKHDNIIIPSYAVLENEFERSTTVRKDELIMANDLKPPIPEFAEVSQTAHINRAIDPDGVIRRAWLQLNTPQGVIDSLAFKAARMAGANVDHYLDNHPQTEILIDFQATQNDFNFIPFSKVVNGDLPDGIFEGRIILVGFTGALVDEGTTPIEKHMNLVYVHANLLSQLLHGTYLTAASDWVVLGIIAVILLLFGWMAWRLKPVATVIVLFALAALLFIVQYVLLSSNGIILNVVDPIYTAFIASFVNIAIRTYYENKQKNYITKQFGRYISPDLVNEIARSDREIQLGGINRELTIMFLDIRGFTPLSEKLSPEEVVDFLNMMFNLITERTLANKGTIDKFIGDAAMLLFNAPLDVPDHEYRAVKTAYEIQQGMVKVREDIYNKYHVELAVGIGINTGNVVVGNIGSYLRVDYTAIGDNVNTAARIEANTERNQILVSESTYERTKAYFEYRHVGEKSVKGKSLPLKLYEVVAPKQPPEQP